MTQNAANSLLKTLEEPPGDALLILVADRNGHLPATIFSRCQRFDVRPPAEAEALAWLDRLRPGSGWAEALAQAGNAPLAAIDALEQRDTHAALARDLREIATGAAPVLDVAERWARLDAGFVLDWLARQVVAAIRRAVANRGSPAGGGVDESVLQRMDRRNLFCYLDTINRLRGQSAGSFNVRLTMESLLIDWAEGLANVGREPAGGLSTR
jgi:DNA polymerase-3 subunit delta'